MADKVKLNLKKLHRQQEEAEDLRVNKLVFKGGRLNCLPPLHLFSELHGWVKFDKFILWPTNANLVYEYTLFVSGLWF
jgi:hypothetical protein